jgi:hypothetical protein
MSFRADRRTDGRTDDKARGIASFSGENALKIKFNRIVGSLKCNFLSLDVDMHKHASNIRKQRSKIHSSSFQLLNVFDIHSPEVIIKTKTKNLFPQLGVSHLIRYN